MGTDEFYIDRKNTLNGIRKDIFVTQPGNGSCHSIMGPNDIGKTTLVSHWAEEFLALNLKDIYYFATTMAGINSFWEYWSQVFRRFSEKIPEERLRSASNPDEMSIVNILDAYDFFNDAEWQMKMGEMDYNMAASDFLDNIFENYTNLGIHIIITIDEFDLARTIFPVETNDGLFFQRLFELSQKGSGRGKNLTILLISRRRIGTIAHHMVEGSSIESAYPPESLDGFNDQELEEYFKSYEDLSCGVLDEQRRQDVLYYCGRHPGLLAKMRYLIDNYGTATNIGDLYARKALPIEAIYDRLSSLLRTEYVNLDKTVNCVGTYMQSFVGPAYESNLKERLRQIGRYGLVTMAYGKSIYELSGLDKPKTFAMKEGYEPISPYFVEFVKNRVAPEELDGLGRQLNQTELNVRKIILLVLQKNFPEKWEHILEENTPATKVSYRRQLDKRAIENDADARNVTYTNLDIMAFRDYAIIIKKYWSYMQPYMQSYQKAEDITDDFDFLNDCRNCHAHLNGGILDEESCARLRKLCDRLNCDFEDGRNGVVRETEVKAVVEENCPSPTLGEQTILIGQTAVFCCKEKTKRGGLRGVLKGNGYSANISPAQAKNILAPIGKELSVKLTRWDSNGSTFNAELL